MKLVVKIEDRPEDYDDVSEIVSGLYSRGINLKTARGGYIVDLPLVRDDQFLIPEELLGKKIFIDCSEHGGGTSIGGSGTVICGLSGRALSPYYRHKMKPGSERLGRISQARFSIPGSVVAVTGRSRDNYVIIERFDVEEKEDMAFLKKTCLWKGVPPSLEAVCPICGKYFTVISGEHEDRQGNKCWGKPSLRKLGLPREVANYHDACMAALAKARCPYCRCVHYAE